MIDWIRKYILIWGGIGMKIFKKILPKKKRGNKNE